jgi:hypothetical protein
MASPIVLPAVTTHNLVATRMAVLKSGPWQVFFHYGQLTASHAKPEALTYEASYGTVDVTHNTGVVGYMSPFNTWFRSPLNQNVPLIDGLGEDQVNPGELLEFNAELPRIAAAQAYGRGGRAERTLEIKGQELSDTVRITTKQSVLEHLGLAIHVQGHIHLSPGFAPDPDLARRNKSFTYWTDVKVASYRDRAEFDVDYGSVVLRLSVALPGAFQVWHGVTPDQPVLTSGQRESLYVELSEPAARAVIVTTWKRQSRK